MLHLSKSVEMICSCVALCVPCFVVKINGCRRQTVDVIVYKGLLFSSALVLVYICYFTTFRATFNSMSFSVLLKLVHGLLRHCSFCVFYLNQGI